MNWLLFCLLLLGPVVATCVAGALEPKNGNVAPGIALFGGGIAGSVCGAMLGCRIGRDGGQKVLLSLLLVPVMAVTCVGMSCIGCLAAGFQMSFG